MTLTKILLSILFGLTVISSANSVNLEKASDTSTINQVQTRLTKRNKLNTLEKGEKEHAYLEPIYDDFEDENDVPHFYSSDAVKDAYENNDSFTSATILSPSFDGMSIATSYSKRINATLHRNEWLWGLWKREVDEDYYRINIYGKANISITLDDIPDNCDYDLEFYEFENVKYCEEDDISLISSSTHGSNMSETISTEVLPNVFYIRVYSYSGFNAQSNYSLNVNVDYNYKNESIADLKYSKNAGAAVWISDFDPFGIEAFSSSSSQEIGFFSSSQYYSTYKIAHPYTSILRSQDSVLHASLFIWDKDIRITLYETVNELIKTTEDKINKNERIKIRCEIGSEIINGVSVVSSITLTIISAAGGPLTVATVTGLSLIATLTPVCCDAIMEALIPTNKIEVQKDYLAYLRVLATALECNSNTDENEVIRINSSYKIVSESVPLVVQMNYKIDFTPSLQSTYLYNNDLIQAYQENAYFNGTIYPIRSLDDIKKAREKNQVVLEEVNTGGNTHIDINQSIPASLDKGQYYWYNFTAPENAIYTFYTEGTMDTYGELFESIVPGRQTRGRVDYDDDIDLENNNRNFSIEYPMYKGHSIYIRIHGYAWEKTGLYSFRVEKRSNLLMNTETISNVKLNYRGEYVDLPESTSVTLDSGFTFMTKRLRCGYIENNYLTLSAKCKDAGIAYLEFDFTHVIQSFSFDMGIWSDDERLNTNSSITLEVKDGNGQWIVYNAFNIASLSKNKDALDSFDFDFSFNVYGTRIKVTTNAVTSTKNKGRVVLDNITLKY